MLALDKCDYRWFNLGSLASNLFELCTRLWKVQTIWGSIICYVRECWTCINVVIFIFVSSTSARGKVILYSLGLIVCYWQRRYLWTQSMHDYKGLFQYWSNNNADTQESGPVGYNNYPLNGLMDVAVKEPVQARTHPWSVVFTPALHGLHISIHFLYLPICPSLPTIFTPQRLNWA